MSEVGTGDILPPLVVEQAGVRDNEPIGERIIGLVDPRTLSQEAFENSPELLFHGADKTFEFSRDYDYAEEKFSHTLGEGLYTTDRRAEAEAFSQRRLRVEQADTVVYSFLPYQARMLDLRLKSDPSRNAPVPRDFMQQWVAFYKTIVQANFPDNYDLMAEINYINSPESLRDTEERGQRITRMRTYDMRTTYIRHLQTLLRKQQSVDLRNMLGRDGDATEWLFTKHDFTEFMKQQGFDGIIQHEGGDTPEQRKRNPTSYVFYNLEKVGTYQTWHQ